MMLPQESEKSTVHLFGQGRRHWHLRLRSHASSASTESKRKVAFGSESIAILNIS